MSTDFFFGHSESLLKVLPFLLGLPGAIYTIHQFRTSIPKSRSRLKLDLEILNLLSKTDRSHKVMKRSIDARITQIYSRDAAKDPTQGRKVYNKRLLTMGIATLAIFVPWTIYLFAFRGSWWALLTGFFALGGFGNLMSAYDPKSERTRPPPPGATQNDKSKGEGVKSRDRAESE